MEDVTEKRNSDRHPCEVPVIWSYFNRDQVYNGRKLNYSREGVYFESDTPPRPGATILIKRHYGSEENCVFEMREGYREIILGEVRWCNEIRDGDNTYCGVGVQYFEAGYP